MIYTIKSELLTATVSSIGAELISVKGKGGKEYVWQGDERYWNRHAPILFPICGRLLDSCYTYNDERYDMGIHGFARDMEFSVCQVSDSSLTMALNESARTLAVFPFPFTLTVKYTVSDTELTMEITVENNSNTVMPYMLGWHPGFNIQGRIDDYTLAFSEGTSAKRHYMQSNMGIEPVARDFPLDGGVFLPTEKEIYSCDTVILTHLGDDAVLSHKADGPRLRMKQSANLPFFAIWKAPATEAEYICLEPWSDIPADGYEPECFDTRKMSRLDAGKAETYVFTVEFY